MNKGDKVYYARILDKAGVYEVAELTIRTVESDYFVGTEERTKQAFLFDNNSLDNTVFYNRNSALNKVLNTEKDKTSILFEKYYEEY